MFLGVKNNSLSQLHLLPDLLELKGAEKNEKGQTPSLAAVVEKISMSLIDPFPHHPLYVWDDSEMVFIMMVDSNSQRTRLLSSERPFAYKM